MVALIFYIIAIVLFAVAAFGVSTERLSLVPLGLAFFAAGHIVGQLG